MRTSHKVRWRDNAHITVTGHWLRFQGLLTEKGWIKWGPSYSYRVVLHAAEIRSFLNYAQRGLDWKIAARDQDIVRWFKDQGRGLMRATFIPTRGNGVLRFNNDVEVGFTDRDTAVMFKLVFGGR